MTCPDAHEQLSSLLDDTLGPAERAALEAHVGACPDCRRELEALRATVALLGRLPAPHAPPGFVDRVVTAAYRPPWPRRVLNALFVPLRVKLPLEAVAVLLVSVSALYLYQRTPEVRELARQEAREAPPASPVAPPGAPAPPSAAPEIPTQPPAALTAQDRASEPSRPPAAPPAPREPARPAPPAVALPPPPAASPDSRAAASAPPAVGPQQKPREAQETEGPRAEERADALEGKLEDSKEKRAAKSSELSASRDAAGTGSRGPSPAPPAGVAPKPPSPAPEPRGGEAGTAPASPSSPGASASGGPPAAAKSNVARRLMRAVDASGRLAVPAREPAETALDALLARLGARRVERRLEGDRGLVVIDVLVPGARYRELIEGLGRIGRWVTDHEPGTLPAQLRVEVALTVEP